MKSALEMIKTWPKWKQKLAGVKTMHIDDFIAEYCNPNCDKGGAVDCCCSFDGTCSKSRVLSIEITEAKGV